MNNLSEVSGIPLYVQIRESIRQSISDGTFIPGQQIPSEDQLCLQFNVSRMTVRQAIADLLREGLLYKRHGVGTFVSQVFVNADYTKLTSFSQEVISQGKTPGTELVEIKHIKANAEIARALLLKDDEDIIRIKRLRTADGQPIAIQISFIPFKLCPQLLREDASAFQSITALFERMGYRYSRAIETISACIANDDQALLLDTSVGAPLLFFERTTFCEEGIPVEFVQTYHRPDRYRCMILLSK